MKRPQLIRCTIPTHFIIAALKLYEFVSVAEANTGNAPDQLIQVAAAFSAVNFVGKWRAG